MRMAPSSISMMTRQSPTRKRLYGDVQRIIADDAPYVSLWYKTNVAVFQSALHGVHLSPIAEFTFLKDVAR